MQDKLLINKRLAIFWDLCKRHDIMLENSAETYKLVFVYMIVLLCML